MKKKITLVIVFAVLIIIGIVSINYLTAEPVLEARIMLLPEHGRYIIEDVYYSNKLWETTVYMTDKEDQSFLSSHNCATTVCGYGIGFWSKKRTNVIYKNNAKISTKEKKKVLKMFNTLKTHDEGIIFADLSSIPKGYFIECGEVQKEYYGGASMPFLVYRTPLEGEEVERKTIFIERTEKLKIWLSETLYQSH